MRERIFAEPPGLPVLSGNYEVILPGRGERIYFADTAADAAWLVAAALDADCREYDALRLLIEAATQRGELATGQYGMRVHRLRDRKQWIGKVRGRQLRPGPAYKLGELVHTDALENDVPASKPGRVSSVYLTNHADPARQYVYGVGAYQLRENSLSRFF